MIYTDKQWWEGPTPDTRGNALDPQPAKPAYRATWNVRYKTSAGNSHVGVIQYVFRAEGLPDLAVITRTKNDAREVVFVDDITERIVEAPAE